LPAGSDYELQISAGTAGALGLTVPFQSDLALDLYLDTVNAEGFESGDMTGTEWYHAGPTQWYAQSAEVFSGNYASRSGAIGNNIYSQIQAFVD